MTRTEAIKYLNINVSNSEVERNPDIVRLCSDAGTLEYAKSKTGHWIPVSERLPEPDIEVLVTDDAGGLATISTDSIYESEVTGEKDWYTSQNVTAWMPLPEPYKEVKE